MDCPSSFWRNRLVDRIRKRGGLRVREENKNRDGRITKRAIRSNGNPTERRFPEAAPATQRGDHGNSTHSICNSTECYRGRHSDVPFQERTGSCNSGICMRLVVSSRESAERIRGHDGQGRALAISATILPWARGNRLMCEEFTLSRIPSVAKAARTDSPVHPNGDDESSNGLRRSAPVRISSLPTLGDRGNPAVDVSFIRLP
jgi:hypothetical protein